MLLTQDIIGQILAKRGIKDREAFLNPRLTHLRDPMEIPDITRAARRVLLAKERKEKVLVFGDYDVDGVSGTAILLHVLKFLGISADYYIPHRYGEGYGMSETAVANIAESGVKLIITVDCGVANVAEVAKANSLGLEVIVTDHHNIPDNLPKAYAIVNPKLISGDHPSQDLSGAGVAFKFAWALMRIAGTKDNLFLTSLLDLAALGTFSDVVPLTRENRVLAVNGLKLLNDRKRLGIRHLTEVAAIKGKISVRDVTFGLAPRINAAGRLEHASKSVELFLTADGAVAKSLAQELQAINIRRRGIGQAIKEQVFANLNDDYVAHNKVVVLSGQDWHPGVVGIVASQVVDKCLRPAVLVGVNEGVGRGSARSLDGINIYELLCSCKDLFVDFGGHAGAAGFEIHPEKIPELKDRLREQGNKTISDEDLQPKLAIDAELAPSVITMSLAKELEVLAPFGEGNPAPIFISRNLSLFDCRQVGKEGKHLKAKFTDGQINLDTIGFGLGELSLSSENKYDIAYKLETNEWNGFETVQLSLVEVRAVDTSQLVSS
ncbi:single-stranded-DNA-specific exonuclease RecJ [Candidatus Margulisiibacteriota bacterium]